MFYAHFVLSKKGPLARIWLAAHWDKKLTKAHVFETDIKNSVDAILEPKVKMALRTSGHLLLGVVRIYSRKAKYLLADCNEAFVKIKMAFRPGVVDLPEDGREAAVAAITLPETFHDFETTMADLNDIDVQAQFSVNQSRPEEITMREDFGNITLVGDDGFGDIGFDDREAPVLQDATIGVEDSLYKNPESSNVTLDSVRENDREADRSLEKPMEVDMEEPIKDDGFGGPAGGMLARAESDDDDDGGLPDAGDDDDDDDHFGGDVDHTLFGDGFMEGGPLFEDAPMAEVSMVPEVAPGEHAEKEVAAQAAPTPAAPAHADQTTLVHNEQEAFALEPLDVTTTHGTERKAKRKRKLIVDEQKGIPSETMKLQLSDTSEIVTTLDLAPPTKKLMHWKETGGVEKLFALSGRPVLSKNLMKTFNRNLVTTSIKEEDLPEEERSSLQLLDEPEVAREEELPPVAEELPPIPEQDSTIVQAEQSRAEESTIIEKPTRSRKSKEEKSLLDIPPETPGPEDNDIGLIDFQDHVDMPQDIEGQGEQTEEQLDEMRWNKRSQQMLHSLQQTLKKKQSINFSDITRANNRKQAASKFYTFLVLKKQEAVEVKQTEPFGEIMISRGPTFTKVC